MAVLSTRRRPGPWLWQDTPVYNILVVGDIHEGKSQKVDAMLDPAVDQPSPDILEMGDAANANGTSKGCISYWGRVIAGRRIKIFDPPGISDGTAFLEYEGDDDAASSTNSRTVEGTGGLLALIQDTFDKNEVHLVLVVHPSNETAIKLGGNVLRCLIELGLMAGDKAEASKNIKVVFTKADLLEPPKLTDSERLVRRMQLEKKVLPLYFNGLGGLGTGDEPKHCYTYGEPWDDNASIDVMLQRPQVKGVNTLELDALIAQVIRARPNFRHELKVPPEVAKVIAEMGYKQAFGSAEGAERFLKGYEATKDELAYRKTHDLLPTGKLNCHEERRRIAVHLENADKGRGLPSGWTASELRVRDEFLRVRSGKKGEGPSSHEGLKREFRARGHIGDVDEVTGKYPHRQGFPHLCPPRGHKGDIAWALYEKAKPELVGRSGKVYKDGFDGSKRVPHVADEDAPSSARSAPGSGTGTGTGTPTTATGPSTSALRPGSSRGGPSTPARPRPPHAREQPKRGGKANAGAAERASPADSPPPRAPARVPVEVLRKRPYKNLGHQYECKLEGGGKAWLPAKVLEERHPQLVAAFNAAAAAAAAAGDEADPGAAVSSTASASEEGEAAEADQPAQPPERDAFAFVEEAARGPAKKKPRSPAWVSQR